jgi:adenine deaminase
MFGWVGGGCKRRHTCHTYVEPWRSLPAHMLAEARNASMRKELQLRGGVGGSSVHNSAQLVCDDVHLDYFDQQKALDVMLMAVAQHMCGSWAQSSMHTTRQACCNSELLCLCRTGPAAVPPSCSPHACVMLSLCGDAAAAGTVALKGI